MKLKTKATTYGVAGLALAGAIIFSGSSLGLLGVGASGILSVLLTDPPSVPPGVTAVYITYSNIAVHAEGFANSGWIALSGHGTIDTMELGTLNLSETISSDVIPSLVYNQMALTIAGAAVEFHHQNYSVTVTSGRLVTPFVGVLMINSSNPATALVDIQPTVLNLGGRSNPSFTLIAGAKALQVPSNEASPSTRVVGHEFALEGHSWFAAFKASHSDTLNSSSAVLTPASLSLRVMNPGQDPVTLRMVMVASNTTGSEGDDGYLSSIVSNVLFAVQPDGSLQLLAGPPGQVQSSFEEPGFTLAPGATQVLSYSGNLATIFGGQIVSGDTYYVVVVGAGVISVQAVTAS
ncbi:MAG: hypothetical protein JRN16_03925 [Nitrososphaerota archaeon]|nr:hypothetical protein [Nitrososphaerota archaeon]MDG6975568.1 hypothetical protein [Nitrososphaerota archaeon]MDG7027541.1 hypothetical protein [Nitrososphaerota archaeon]